MKHYQIKEYKYGHSKSKISPVDSRRSSGLYRLFCNSPPCRQANHDRIQSFSYEWDDKQSRLVATPVSERTAAILAIAQKYAGI